MACAVVLDGKRLQMSTGETEQEHILALEQGELMINWEHHRAGLGQAVEITSGADRHAFFSPHQTRLFRAHACVYVGHADFGVLELGPCAGTLCCRPAVYGRSPNAFKHARSGLRGALVPWHAFQRWCQVCRASKTWVPTERDQ